MQQELTEDLPEHDLLPFYGPDFTRHINAEYVQDENDSSIDDLIELITLHLNKL